MDKRPRNSDHQPSGCGVPATELSLSITPCFMVRRSDFPVIVLLQDLGCITEIKDSILNCLSPSGLHLDSTVFQNTDRQHGSYLWSKCAACSECGWQKQVSAHEEVSTARMELSLGQWDISVTWINRRMLLAIGKTLSRPWKLKKKTQSWLSRWFNDRMNKGKRAEGSLAREGTLSKFLWQPPSFETSNTRFPMEIFLIIPARHVFCFL